VGDLVSELVGEVESFLDGKKRGKALWDVFYDSFLFISAQNQPDQFLFQSGLENRGKRACCFGNTT